MADSTSAEEQQLHPLHRGFTWWCWWTGGKNDKWEDNMLQVMDFSSVEDFWALYEHMTPATRLNERMSSNYAVMRKGLRPTWEDCEEHDGGDWLVVVPRSDERSMRKLDDWWMQALLVLIGENFDDATGSDSVLGVFLSRRTRETRLYVRSANAPDEAMQKRIGSKIRQLLDIPSDIPIEYKRPSERNTVLYRV